MSLFPQPSRPPLPPPAYSGGSEPSSDAAQEDCRWCKNRGYYLERFSDNWFTPCQHCWRGQYQGRRYAV